MKTLIAIPCMSMIPWEFSKSMDYLIKGENVSILYKPNSLIYDARNLISLTAIENDFDRVMWFDSDILFQPDTLQILHHDMDFFKCGMVTGIYVKRHLPDVEPVIYQKLEEPERDESGRLVRQIEAFHDYPKDEVFPVRGCGFGCVLTSVPMLKDVWDHYGPAFTPYPWAGEDISFCHRANQLGYQILCDPAVSCGHIGSFVYTEDLLKRGDVNEVS